MPIYEYECGKCGSTIEVIQKFSDPPLQTHEGCGGSLTKLISAAGFQFKGTGWYVTDYARKTQQGTESSKDPKKDSKEASSNGDKEGSTGKSAESGKTDSSPNSSASKD
jgi:putative FmdB family regulatory protein